MPRNDRLLPSGAHVSAITHGAAIYRIVATFLLFVSLFVTAGADNVTAVEESYLDPVDAARDRKVPLKIYRVSSETPQPVILFSHGLGGSRDGNPYLGKHWASAGFVCVFIQHPGSDRDVWQSAAIRERMAALKRAASVVSSRDRCADVSFVIDQLERWNREEGHPLEGKLDLDRIGMSGHSFGAVTTMAVAGRRFPFRISFAEQRIDAFVAMSPQPGKGIPPDVAFGELDVPVLTMTGTQDDSPIDDSTTPELRREVFKSMPVGDKYELVFDGGHHFTFSDSDGLRARRRDPDHHPAIQQISLKFWQAYLKKDLAAKAWLQSAQPRKDCKLKSADVWQWK